MASGEADKQYSAALEENLKKALTELLVLKLLSEKDRYIGELSAAIHDRSNGALTVVFPYGAIYRLQQAGYITEKEKRSAPDGRRRQPVCLSGNRKPMDPIKLLLPTRASRRITSFAISGWSTTLIRQMCWVWSLTKTARV